MLKLLIDTSVWLDIAKDSAQQMTLHVLNDLIDLREVQLLIPQTIIEEFNRNKDRVVKDSNSGYSNTLKRAKLLIDKYGLGETKQFALQQLNDVTHLIPSFTETSLESTKLIDTIFKKSVILETSESLKLKAAQRAIDKVAPFHRNKNSFNDAIIIETYIECLKERRNRKIQFAFVTHNTSDFSNPLGNDKEPHPQLAAHFEDTRSMYFINLNEAIKLISADLISELMIDYESFSDEPRPLSEILTELEVLFDKIWYNRHHNWLYKIKNGEQKIVAEATSGKYNANETPLNIYKGALKAARRLEKKHGLENLGPWDDFEWGVLNGKMSASRWVLGDEWDFLDT